MLVGKLFHICGPIDLNEPQWTNSVMDLVVYNVPLLDDLRPLECGGWLVTNSDKYAGGILLMHLNIIVATL